MPFDHSFRPRGPLRGMREVLECLRATAISSDLRPYETCSEPNKAADAIIGKKLAGNADHTVLLFSSPTCRMPPQTLRLAARSPATRSMRRCPSACDYGRLRQ
jgi:hypothetical protein